MSMLAADIDYNRLNNLLWRYRGCLDRFEFLLEIQLTVTASARPDWQHHLADLLEELATTIGRLDLERAVLVGEEFNLSRLSAEAPEMWSAILAEHQAAMTASTVQIGQLRKRNEQVISAGAAGLQRLIDAIAEAGGADSGGAPESYGDNGRPTARAKTLGGSPLLFDGRA